MRLTPIFAAAAIALVSTFAVADDAADKAIRKSLENLELEVFQAFTNGFVGRVIGDGKGADQRNGCGGENLGQTHENS